MVNPADENIQTSRQQAEKYFKSGLLSDSKKVYLSILQVNPFNLQALINLSTICLQQNNLLQSKSYINLAIKKHPFSYISYYNKALILIFNEQSKQALELMRISLSLIYMQIGYHQNDLDSLNKAIYLCGNNLQAYLYRAKYYQKTADNNKTAQFQQLLQLIEQQRRKQINPSFLSSFYLQLVLFYRRQNNQTKMQQMLVIYKQLQNQTNQCKQSSRQDFKLINISSEHNINLIKRQLKRYSIEIQSLIKQIHKGNVVVNTDSDTIDFNKIKFQNKQSIQTAVLKKSKDMKHLTIHHNDQSLINIDIATHQQDSSILDQDSIILNTKIHLLQQQLSNSIKNTPHSQILPQQTQQNFLQLQIEQTLNEIIKEKQKKDKDMLSKSLGSQSKISDTSTFRSRVSDKYQIQPQDMKAYKAFKMEVRSVTMFDDKGPKKESYLKVNYHSQQFQTDKSKTDKFTWNFSFQQKQIIHSTKNDLYILHCELHAKQGGWMSWKSDLTIGTGTIRLTDKGQTKCTLESKGKKIGILYYKIKLIKQKQ